ncbi:MAG: PilZ domain-containing protein [Sphingomonas sp.]|nr:PilZ domain-containing protein [Sphingomonas sp.]
MDNSTNAQNRRTRRSQVLLSATLQHGGAEHSVKLRNLSSEGALVESEKLPIEGTPVVFCRNDLCASGRVVWVNGRYAGIAFFDRLEPTEVLRHVPAPRPKLQPRYWRPGLSSSKMTADQRRLAESWVWSPALSRPGE